MKKSKAVKIAKLIQQLSLKMPAVEIVSIKQELALAVISAWLQEPQTLESLEGWLQNSGTLKALQANIFEKEIGL